MSPDESASQHGYIEGGMNEGKSMNLIIIVKSIHDSMEADKINEVE